MKKSLVITKYRYKEHTLKKFILSEREMRLIERWQMNAINRIPELQFLLMKQIVFFLQEEGLEPRIAQLVDCPSSGVSHIVYSFDYSDIQRFDVELEYMRENQSIEFKPFYLNENSNIIYTQSIKEAIDNYYP